MNDGTFRGEWVDEVFRSPLITDAVRVALLALAREMDDDGLVEADRSMLAGRLARHERKVSERYRMAQEAGFLKKVRGGNRGGPNVFQATLPPTAKGAARRHPFDGERVPVSSTQTTDKGADPQHPFQEKGAEGRQPSEPGKGAEGRQPFSSKGADTWHPEGQKRVPVRSTSVGDVGTEVKETADQLFGDEEIPPSARSAGRGTVVSLKPPTENQRARALANIYSELVPLSKYIANQQIAKRAITAGRYTDEQIAEGLRRVAAEGWTLTVNSLRIAIEGRAKATDTRFAPGTGSQVPGRDEYKTENVI